MTNLAALGTELESIVPQRMAEEDVPGIAIGLCTTEATWSRGFGTIAADDDRPVDTQTMFSVQSTSKLVTATAVLAAVDQGLLDLDATVAESLPDFSVRSTFEDRPEQRMTLRSLLQHTAGFTHEAPVGSNYQVGRASFAAHIASITRTWLRYPVGHHHEYSNLGVDLAGAILQQVTRTPFSNAVRRLLFTPLGMDRSTFGATRIAQEPNRARGSWRRATAAGRRLPVRVPMVPSGGLYTSVDDALRFVRLQLRGGAPVISPPVYAELGRLPGLVPHQTEGYGLCVYVDTWDGVPVRHHGGSGFGFLSQLFWLPEHGVGGVVLSNSLNHDLQNELAHSIAATVAGSTPEGRPDRIESPGVEAAVAGRYLGRLNDIVDVEVRDGIATLTGDLDRPGDRYRFLPGPGGAVHYLQNLRDGSVRYRTAPDDRARVPVADGYLGGFVTRIAGVPVDEYEVRDTGDGPVVAVPTSRGPVDLALFTAPGGYRSATGEALEMNERGVTYRNIPLHRIRG